MSNSDELIYASEPNIAKPEPRIKPWKVAIVDDELDVHLVTKMALKDLIYDSRPVQFLSAFNTDEGKLLFQQNPDISVCLMDVVMEYGHSGLDLIDYIRNDLQYSEMRIILRTGQPGEAPEEQIISRYDINDYKEKTELTAVKLKSAVVSSLRSYKGISELEHANQGLKKIIKATSKVYKESFYDDFAKSLLVQVSAILPNCNQPYSGLVAYQESREFVIAAGVGKYQNQFGKSALPLIPDLQKELLMPIQDGFRVVSQRNRYLFLLKGTNNRISVIHLEDIPERNKLHNKHLYIFCRHVFTAFETLFLQSQLAQAQLELVYLLGDTIESRNKSSHNSLKRISDISFLLAKGLGMENEKAEEIKRASSLHNIGKILIPDELQNCSNALTQEQKQLYQSHTIKGERLLLSRGKNPLLKCAADVARHHHEKWDGTGYPDGLKGNEISEAAQIVAVASAFDEQCILKNCNSPGAFEELLEDFKLKKGNDFSPRIVNALIEYSELVMLTYELNPFLKSDS